jgi:RNA polymerase sigma factor (sigma-70 family)
VTYDALVPPPAPFATTLWSTIVLARDGDADARKAALDRLCARYWTPLYAYLLRKGLSRDDAQDAVQGFFAYFLEKELLQKVERGRGKFRRYLLAVLEHWLANERRVATAQKRGGFDFPSAHRTLSVDPAAPADEAFRRTWAMEVLRDAMGRLKREYHELGRSRRFEAVASHLAAGADRPPTEEIARRLGITNDDVYRIVHEARRRLQEHIRAVLRDTVETDAEVDEELADLFG